CKSQEDLFDETQKIVFDGDWSEVLPGKQHSYRFKDYAPQIFMRIRKSYGAYAEDYPISLNYEPGFSVITSPGKSGSVLFYSGDGRFIMKTISRTEHKFMLKILRSYSTYMSLSPNTLLCRYYGLHRVKDPDNKKFYFVVMQNIFPDRYHISRVYDIKGCTHHRYTHEDGESKVLIVLKDLNWFKDNQSLKMTAKKRKEFMAQIKSDVEFLIKSDIMDYSLLVGIYEVTEDSPIPTSPGEVRYQGNQYMILY
ncbi:hypothetical protein BDB01DRAFT_874274, partial [Pilobolus umbonatus]